MPQLMLAHTRSAAIAFRSFEEGQDYNDTNVGPMAEKQKQESLDTPM